MFILFSLINPLVTPPIKQVTLSLGTKAAKCIQNKQRNAAYMSMHQYLQSNNISHRGRSAVDL